MAVVAQLCAEDGTGSLGIDDSGTLEMLRPMARLEIQLCFVMAPGTVGNSHDGLLTVFKALTPWLQGHALNEVPV